MVNMNIREISPKLQKKAEAELNEVPSRIAEDILALKTWIGKQAHLRARTDDQFLLAFLRGCKYSLERVKEKLDLHFTIRGLMTDVFIGRDPTDPISLEIIRTGNILPLPLTESSDGPVVILMRPGVCDPAKYSMIQVMQVQSMILDLFMRDNDQLVIGGQTVILDLENTGMGHFLQLNPTLVKKMTTLAQDASPLRQKGVHYIHTPTGFETIFNLFKGFMNEKNKKKLYVHGENMEALYKYVPRRLLPTEYGGEGGPIQDIIDEWEKKLIANKDYFKEDENYGTDENKRVGRPKNAENLFGVDGSFRKLDVF